ncbi:MAG: hypothetical protein K5675_00770 [Lachnospiraceae bacterium]|nr:hypothetical protein [Lachnospiraceae bacterium]
MNGKLTRVVAEGNTIWFTDHRYAALFFYNLNEKKCELYTYLRDVQLLQVDELAAAAKYENRIIIAPIRGDEIIVCDRATSQLRNYKIHRSVKDNGFCSAIVNNDYLWITPSTEKYILCFDMKNETLEYIDITDNGEHKDNENNIYGYAINVGNSIWLPCLFDNAILEFDMNSKKLRKCPVALEGAEVSVLSYCNGLFYILNERNHKLIEWNQKGHLREIEFSPFQTELKLPIHKTVVIGDEILFLPREIDDFWVYSAKEDKWRKIADKPNSSSLYEEAVIIENKVYGFDLREGINFIWNHDTDEMAFFEIEFSNCAQRLLTDMNLAQRIQNHMPVTYQESECDYYVFIAALSKLRN